MTAVEARSDQRRSAAEWTVRAAWLLALIATALQLIGVLVALGGVPELLTANPITASIETDQPLRAVGQNSYGGTAFVADDAHVAATRITAEVHDAATSVRVGLAFGPLAWAITGAGVGLCLTLAFGRFAAVRPRPRRASRALAIAAVIAAIGTSAGQILDEMARTGLQGVTWHGAAGVERIGVGPGFTFQFGWLAAAIGLLAIAAVVARPNDAPSPPTP